MDAPRQTVAAQWDGSAYHRAAEWQPTSGFVLRRLGYEPRWPYVYWQSGVLFELEDAFVAGDGIRVREPSPGQGPAITSSPPPYATVGAVLTYGATGTGDAPLWWSLAAGPDGARVDAATGALSWTPTQSGPADFLLRLEWVRTIRRRSWLTLHPGGESTKLLVRILSAGGPRALGVRAAGSPRQGDRA